MSIRFRILKDGHATISGIHYQDFRSLMDAAALHYYEDLEKIRKKTKPNEDGDEDWANQQLKVLDYIKLAINKGIADTFPKRQEYPLTKEERWEKVLDEKKEREFMRSLLEVVMLDAVKVKLRKSKKKRKAVK